MAGIRAILAASPFHGEGYRKVRARLAHRGLAVSGKRVLRLMRQHGLLAPRRLGPPNGDPAHAGTIITDAAGRDVGHRCDALLHRAGGVVLVLRGHRPRDRRTRRLARRQARRSLGGAGADPPGRAPRLRAASGKDVARGLAIRCDWGPQYIADAWINEVKWLGITISPSYVGEPECNGVIERFMRTLKEQCLYLHRFQTLEEARRIIAEFIERYNHEWLIERLGYRTPAAARAAALAA